MRIRKGMLLWKSGNEQRRSKRVDYFPDQDRIFLPLVVAAIHELAAFPIVRRLLALLNLTNVRLYVICMGITFLLFSAIYYIVFRVTSQAYYRIVDGKAR